MKNHVVVEYCFCSVLLCTRGSCLIYSNWNRIKSFVGHIFCLSSNVQSEKCAPLIMFFTYIYIFMLHSWWSSQREWNAWLPYMHLSPRLLSLTSYQMSRNEFNEWEALMPCTKFKKLFIKCLRKYFTSFYFLYSIDFQ